MIFACPPGSQWSRRCSRNARRGRAKGKVQTRLSNQCLILRSCSAEVIDRVCVCVVSGRQRFRRPPWSSWRERTQSKYKQRELFGVWWMKGQRTLSLSVSKNKILHSLISKPKKKISLIDHSLCTLSLLPNQGLLVAQRPPPSTLQRWQIWILNPRSSLGRLTHLRERWDRLQNHLTRPGGEWGLLILVFVEFVPRERTEITEGYF